MSRNMELAGRWVLVTGASSGLGEEMARQLARRDHRLPTREAETAKAHRG